MERYRVVRIEEQMYGCEELPEGAEVCCDVTVEAADDSVEDERFPVPVIMPLCLTGDDISEVTFENFGKEVRLYLWERNVA